MQFSITSLRSDVMAQRTILLAAVALALGAGTFVLAWSSVERAATAELSFNPDAAYFDDSSLTYKSDPAVAAAQSILSDTVVLDVLKRAGASVADPAHAIAEFRSGLDLSEHSLDTLRIRDRDPDPRRAGAVVNAVATALAEWAPPVRPPAARKPAARKRHGVSAAPLIPVWQNPFRIARLAGAVPRVLARPGRLAIWTSVVFFAAAACGVFLYWRREMLAVYAAEAVRGVRALARIPPLPVAKWVAEQRQKAAVVAAPEPVASQPQAVWQPVAVEREADRQPVALRPQPAPEPNSTEPEDGWEPAAREPEDLWEAVAAEQVPAGAPIAQLTFAFQFSQEAEIVALRELAHPALAAPEPVAEAQSELVSPVEEAVTVPEMRRPEAQPETAPEVAPASALARLDEPSAAKPEAIEKPKDIAASHPSFVDSGADADWSARILLGFARTSIGQKLEHDDKPGGGGAEWNARILQDFARASAGQKPNAEQRSNLPNRLPKRLPAPTSDRADTRDPRESERA